MVTLAALCSCVREDEFHAPQEVQSSELDTAIEAMYSMMDELYGEGTRSLPSKKIVEIIPIYAPSSTRVIGGGGSDTDNTLVYIVNFDYNSGFSVLSTHPAVENVLALGDSGNLKAAYFTQAVSACSSADECQVCATAEPEELDEDYEPDDVPGYDYDDESYMRAFVRAPFTVTPANCPIPNPVVEIEAQQTIARLIIEAVWTTVQKYIKGVLSPEENLGGNKYWAPWESTQGIPPMINNKWHQKSPYNKYCYTSGGDKALAGCVPIAVAQITAYHKRNLPGRWAAINKIGVWDMGKERFYVGSTNIEQSQVARFVKDVGVACKAEYGVEATSSTLSKAKKGMKSLGYTNVKKHKYDPFIVENRLKCGCPVYIQGASSSSAHAWVIDGLMRQRRQSLANGSIQVRTLMHCNWGWEGRYDGYYTSSVFNASNGPHFNDPNWGETRSGGKYNYNHKLKIITYNRPHFTN